MKTKLILLSLLTLLVISCNVYYVELCSCGGKLEPEPEFKIEWSDINPSFFVPVPYHDSSDRYNYEFWQADSSFKSK